MHQRERAGEARVGQVAEERGDLRRREHPLVDQGADRQRREVDLGLTLGALAQAVGHPLERHTHDRSAGGVDEDLAEARHHAARSGTDASGVGRQVAPGDDLEALLGGDGLDRLAGLLLGSVIVGQECDADGVRAAGRKLDTLLLEHRAHELVRHLQEDSRTVSGVRLGPGGTPVLHVLQGCERLGDDLVRLDARQLRHEGHATGVVLELGVVQALGGGGGRPHGALPS